MRPAFNISNFVFKLCTYECVFFLLWNRFTFLDVFINLINDYVHHASHDNAIKVDQVKIIVNDSFF